jgi:glutaredoxin-related protein
MWLEVRDLRRRVADKMFGAGAATDTADTDERFKALQFTYESSEIEESKLSIRSRDAPALAWFLQISDGEADATQATSGTIDLTMDGDWVEGTFELTFGDSGSLDGEFVVEKCTNLKKRKYE